jgi:hypothetical protein
MKKYLVIIILGFIGMTYSSCKKEDFNYPEGYVGISKVTKYATFTMKGDAYQSIVKGGTYTEQGVTAKEGSSDLTVKVSGSVNTAVAGLYIITYSATNGDGFPATVNRYIAVLPSAEVAGSTIAGDYNYATGGTTATITKLAPGFYQADNIWSAATTISAYLISVDGQSIIVPTQANAFGTLSGTGTLAGSSLKYVVSIPEQSISNSTRSWVKK